jgi:tetratricopeptide (TPR) repeat protein
MMLLDRISDSPWIRRGLVGVAVALAVAIVALGGVAWYRAQEASAQTALAEAMRVASGAEGSQATPDARAAAIKALEAVLAEHPRLSTAPQAAYQLGNLKYAAGQYAEARGAYQLALAKGATGSVKALAATGIGYTWEAEKSYANAASAFTGALATLTSKDFLYEEALSGAARSEELAGKPAAALELYQRLLRDVPESRRADDARGHIASLKSKLGQ